MKGKHLFLLLLLVGAVGATWHYQFRHRPDDAWNAKGTGGAGGKVFYLALNDVARVTVKTADAELNLVKKDDAWTVQERASYPANFDQLSGLLRKLSDLKTVQEVKGGPSQFARLELVEPGKGAGAGTLVGFKDKDGKALGGLLLGKKFMKKGDAQFGEEGGFPAGRYVVPFGTQSVSLVAEPLDEVNVKPESWLARDFFKIENPKAVTLAGTGDPQHWKLTRETATAEWKLDGTKDDEKADPAKTAPLPNVFASPTFTDVLAPDAKPEDTGLDKPAVATFETFDGFTYTLKIGKPSGESYPLTVEVAAALTKERTPGKEEKPEDKAKLDGEFKTTLKRLEDKFAAEKKFEGRLFLIPKTTIDQLLKDRAAFLPEKTPEVPAPAASAPVSVTTPPISVTTPPVTVPPAPNPAPPAPPAPAKPEPNPAPPEPAPAKPAPNPAPAPPAPEPAKPAPAPDSKPPADEQK